MILSDVFLMNSLRLKEMFYIDYSLAYTIIKEYGLTSQDKGKIEGIKMGPGVKDVIYKILGTESDEH